MTLLVLVFAEVLPKPMQSFNPERAASLAAPNRYHCRTVFAPMVAAVRMLVRGVSACLAFRPTPTPTFCGA
jgi:Mg2+/Co2+ transporter CorB